MFHVSPLLVFFFQTNQYTSSTKRSAKIKSRILCIPFDNATNFGHKNN